MKLDHRERVFTALDHEEPDMVPVIELDMDPPVIEKILGRKTGADFLRMDAKEASSKNVMSKLETYRKLGMDGITITESAAYPDGFRFEFLDDDTFKDQWGKIFKIDKSTNTTWWVDGILKDRDDIDDYTPPNPLAPGNLEVIEKVLKEASEDMIVWVHGSDAFRNTWQIRGGIDKLIIDLYEEPKSARKLIDKIGRTHLEFNKAIFDLGIDIFSSGDDYCDAHGPMIHPNLFREFFLPWIEKGTREAKKRGVFYFKHSDGNNYPILDDMINAGVRGFHPNEPGIQDLADMKRLYGDRVVLAGAVDCKYVLPSGTEGEVRQDVRRCIDAAAKGGGYILGSSNSIHPNCKAENVITMVDEARKYGRYE